MTEFCWFDSQCWLYFFLNYYFGQSFFSEVFATFIGAVLGVITAIWLRNRYDRRTEIDRKKVILRELLKELMMNFGGLARLELEPNYLVKTARLEWRLKTQFWDTFSDSGDLKWIKNPELLSAIAEAYNFINMMQALSNRYIELLHLSKFDENLEAIDFVTEVLDQGILNTRQEISKATDSIQQVREKENLID